MKFRFNRRRKDERVAHLRGVRELAGLSDRQLRGLAPFFDETIVAPGTRLARAGRPASEFLVVVEGSVVEGGPHGRRLDAGASSGWAAMWERSANSATVVATTRARLLVMGRAQFRGVRALLATRR